MTFPCWIWAEATDKTTELSFAKFKKTLHTFHGFISLRLIIDYNSEISLESNKHKSWKMSPEVQSYFSVFWPPWFPTLCPSILKSRKKINSCPQFFVCIFFIRVHTNSCDKKQMKCHEKQLKAPKTLDS